MSTLYVVATPIGNLSDMSPRAIETLKNVALICAEDTRVTKKLTNHFGIDTPLISCHQHNEKSRGEEITERMLAENIDVAVVTDAGTPAISDPGEDLVRLCTEHDVPVIAICGPCAAITALAVSGLPTGRFTFEGFLSTNKRSRQEHLQSLLNEQRTMIFYEAPHKLSATLEDMRKAFGGARKISLCRELTKLHEEIFRTTLDGAVAHYENNPPKGEFVLIVAGAEKPTEQALTLEDAIRLCQSRIDSGMSKKDAVKLVSSETGFPKNALYDAILK